MYIKHINVCPVWNVLQLLRQQTVGLGRQNPPRDCKQTISPPIIIFIIIVIYFSPLTFISIYCQLEVYGASTIRFRRSCWLCTLIFLSFCGMSVCPYTPKKIGDACFHINSGCAIDCALTYVRMSVRLLEKPSFPQNR